MGVTRPLFVRRDATAGTGPAAARMALAGLLAAPGAGAGGRAGVLGGLNVTGNAGWTYSVTSGHLDTSRSTSDGVAVWALDATGTLSTSVAPGSGSRVDIIYGLHHDIDGGDSDSLPVLGVAQGVAAPSGSVELARYTIPSGTSGTSGGTKSVASRQWSALRGSPIPVETQAQRDAITWGTASEPARVWRIDKGFEEINRGLGWYRTDGSGPSVKMQRAAATAALTVPNSSAGSTTVPLDTTSWNDGYVYTGVDSLTFPLTGRYRLTVRLVFAPNVTGNRYLTYTLSTGQIVVLDVRAGTAANPTIMNGSDEIAATAGDRIALGARQTSGADLAIQGYSTSGLPAADVVLTYLGPS